MEKSQQGTSSGVNVVAAASATTGARSKSSRKSAERPISRGPGLSSSDSINIVMNSLNQLQEHFGKIHFVVADGPKEPALLVLPLTLMTCEKCGTIIERKNGPFCKWHGSAEIGNVVSKPEAQVA